MVLLFDGYTLRPEFNSGFCVFVIKLKMLANNSENVFSFHCFQWGFIPAFHPFRIEIDRKTLGNDYVVCRISVVFIVPAFELAATILTELNCLMFVKHEALFTVQTSAFFDAISFVVNNEFFHVYPFKNPPQWGGEFGLLVDMFQYLVSYQSAQNSERYPKTTMKQNHFNHFPSFLK